MVKSKKDLGDVLAVAYGVRIDTNNGGKFYDSDVEFYADETIRVKTYAGGTVTRKYATQMAGVRLTGTGKTYGEVGVSFKNNGTTHTFKLDANWWFSNRNKRLLHAPSGYIAGRKNQIVEINKAYGLRTTEVADVLFYADDMLYCTLVGTKQRYLIREAAVKVENEWKGSVKIFTDSLEFVVPADWWYKHIKTEAK